MSDQIRQLIRSELRINKLSLKEFAAMIAPTVSARTMYRYLSEDADVRISSVEAMREALGIRFGIFSHSRPVKPINPNAPQKKTPPLRRYYWRHGRRIKLREKIER